MKLYAVRKGRTTGIFWTWAECKAQVMGYSGAQFKGFNDPEAAEAYLQETHDAAPINENLPAVYIDGSYSKTGPQYGYGGFIAYQNERQIIQGTGSDERYINERNIAGELLGTLQAIQKAIDSGYSEVNLFFDYSGIEAYISGAWAAKTPLAQYYKDTMNRLQESITIHFVKVKGHTGDAGNELADYLAKEAVGAKLRKKDTAALQELRNEGTVTDGKI